MTPQVTNITFYLLSFLTAKISSHVMVGVLKLRRFRVVVSHRMAGHWASVYHLSSLSRGVIFFGEHGEVGFVKFALGV